MTSGTAVVILAAGAGTRMRSKTPKVLHGIGGRTLLGHAIAAAAGTDPTHLVVVVGHDRERVGAAASQAATELGREIALAVQHEQRGTGDAVQAGLAALPPGFSGTVVVTAADVPLLDSQTLDALVLKHTADGGAAVTVLTSTAEDPAGYGRILRTNDGQVTAIVEQKDATAEQRAITEINSGVYAFDHTHLASALTELRPNNAQGELYLTDVIAIAVRAGLPVRGSLVPDAVLVAGCNDRVQLSALGRELNRRIVAAHQRAGVTVIDPDTTWIEASVAIAQDVTVEPGTQLRGATVIEEDAVIGPDSTLTDTVVRSGARVSRTQADGAEIGEGAAVGPFTYLRPGTVLGAGGKIGAFVETKNAQIGDGTKVPHLTYVGDATIGAGTNIGCSTVFVNYDGVNKHRTVVGDHARIGSDTMLIAPVQVGDGAYTGAGTVIKRDVPPGSLAVSGSEQRNIDEWVLRRRPDSESAAAARKATARIDKQ